MLDMEWFCVLLKKMHRLREISPPCQLGFFSKNFSAQYAALCIIGVRNTLIDVPKSQHSTMLLGCLRQPDLRLLWELIFIILSNSCIKIPNVSIQCIDILIPAN